MPGGGKAGQALVRRRNAALAALDGHRDRRRFKQGLVASGVVKWRAPEGAKGTTHKATVLDWAPGVGETILKDGAHNQKIGGDVHHGRLAGARILTLSLEERATCPKSCALWRECYGNGMPRARRWRPSEAFEAALDLEVRAWCLHHEKVLVRLHVLGDFYSMDYLALWVRLLDDLPNLNVFGFTAWKPGSEIGAGISRVRAALGRRFAIRHSGMTGKWGSFTLDFPTEQKQIGDALVCPEQLSGNGIGPAGIHCGSCCACWRGDKPIAFMLHG